MMLWDVNIFLMPITREKSKRVFKTILDVVMPPACYVCSRSCSSEYGLCENCIDQIKLETVYREAPIKNAFIEKGWSSAYYKNTIKECIHLFKYSGYVGLIDIFRDIMTNFMKKNQIHREINLIVPVPMYSANKRKRTYNQAEILGKSIAKYFGIPIDDKNLKKVKWTRPQSELDKRERLENLKNSFVVIDKKAFDGKNVLLVDDVYTTGATINECAKALHRAGAEGVFFLTLARGV